MVQIGCWLYQWRRQKFLPAGALQSLTGHTSWHIAIGHANPGLFSKRCFRFQSLPSIQHAFFVGCADSLALWVFALWLTQDYIRFTKPPTNVKPKVNFASMYVQCESKNFTPFLRFSEIFFPNGWEFLIKILHACYSFIHTLNCKILFNYSQLWLVYAHADVYLTCASLYFTFNPLSPTAAIVQWARCSGFMA